MKAELVKTIPEALDMFGVLSEAEIIQKLRLRGITDYSIRDLDEATSYLLKTGQIHDAEVLNSREVHFKR